MFIENTKLLSRNAFLSKRCFCFVYKPCQCLDRKMTLHLLRYFQFEDYPFTASRCLLHSVTGEEKFCDTFVAACSMIMFSFFYLQTNRRYSWNFKKRSKKWKWADTKNGKRWVSNAACDYALVSAEIFFRTTSIYYFRAQTVSTSK